jgi:hypothetical protein
MWDDNKMNSSYVVERTYVSLLLVREVDDQYSWRRYRTASKATRAW